MDNLTKWIAKLKEIIEDTSAMPFCDDPEESSTIMEHKDLKEIRELLIDYLILKIEK